MTTFASRAEAIVKPLDWKAVRKAVIGADGYEITDMSAGNKQGWRGSFPGENTYRWFSTIEDAQDAAQGHYLRSLLDKPQPDSRAEAIGAFKAFYRGLEKAPADMPITAGSSMAKRQLTVGDLRALLQQEGE